MHANSLGRRMLSAIVPPRRSMRSVSPLRHRATGRTMPLAQNATLIRSVSRVAAKDPAVSKSIPIVFNVETTASATSAVREHTTKVSATHVYSVPAESGAKQGPDRKNNAQNWSIAVLLPCQFTTGARVTVPKAQFHCNLGTTRGHTANILKHL